MTTKIIFNLLVAVSLCGCNTSKNIPPCNDSESTILIQSKPYQTVNFAGTVTDIKFNEAIPFASVELRNEKGENSGALTDENGNFSIKNLPLCVYRLRITASGYKAIENVFNVQEYTSFQLDVKLSVQVMELEKPVIYLYPTERQNVHVKLNYDGTLTHTYPKYTEKGWNVTAEPNGTLWDENGLEYYALFWEGEPNDPIIPTDGFVVSGAESGAFLEEKLAFLGLNRREANEFIMYWLPRMENNPYNFIHFSGEQYTALAELEITPKPEQIIRVMMLTQALNSRINFPVQDLSALQKTRKGFTVVEWGGSVIHTINEYN
jgi:hypothetical protein